MKQIDVNVALQGHVVAEEQLRIPTDWLRELSQPSTAPAPPAAVAGEMHVEQKNAGGTKVVAVSGPNALTVEVQPLDLIALFDKLLLLSLAGTDSLWQYNLCCSEGLTLQMSTELHILSMAPPALVDFPGRGAFCALLTCQSLAFQRWTATKESVVCFADVSIFAFTKVDCDKGERCVLC